MNRSERDCARGGLFPHTIPTPIAIGGWPPACRSCRWRLCMNAKLLVSAGAVALATVGCGYSIKTATDYNHNVNFSNYHSFRGEGQFVGKSADGRARGDRRQERADVKGMDGGPERPGADHGDRPRGDQDEAHLPDVL